MDTIKTMRTLAHAHHPASDNRITIDKDGKVVVEKVVYEETSDEVLVVPEAAESIETENTEGGNDNGEE